MVTTARSNKGANLQYVVESTPGVDPGSGYKDLRTEGDPTVTGQFTKSLQPETLFANPNETEKPVLVDVPVEGAVSCKVGLTRGASAGTDAQLVSLMNSAGWPEDSGDNTTVATATSQTALVLTDDVGAPGRGIVVELDDGRFFPALISSNVAEAVTLAMGLPSVTSASKTVKQCHTFYPGAVGPVDTTLTLRHITKALNGADNVAAVFTMASLASIADLEITPGTIPFLEFIFNVAGHSVESLSLSGDLPVNDFTDGPGKKPVDQPYLQLADASSAGAITSALVKLVSAGITFGHTTSGIPGIGDLECINGLQGHRQDPGDILGMLKFLYPADKITDWEGSNPSKYIGIVQPSFNMTQPPWGFIYPNAHILEDPVWEPTSDSNMHEVAIKYKANPALYNSETDESDPANQPMYILLGTESA